MNYNPFCSNEIIGCFTWDNILSRNLFSSCFYHCCHKEYVLGVIASMSLDLRSNFQYYNDDEIVKTRSCLWFCFNNFDNVGYKFGPFRISFKNDVLEGKTFLVVKRDLKYIFVECNVNNFRTISPRNLFNCKKGEDLQPATIHTRYDIVLTNLPNLSLAQINIVPHVNCKDNTDCSEKQDQQNRKWLKEELKIKETATNNIDDLCNLKNLFPDFYAT